jgi:hypothetical protein
MNFQDFAETTAFHRVAHTIAALSIQDERIADEFRAIEGGRISSGKLVEFEGDVPIGMKIKLGDFAQAISTRIWDSVGRANWRNFEDALAFVRSLGLKSKDEWSDYCRSGKKPPDIPSNPQLTYADTGWAGWGDWNNCYILTAISIVQKSPRPSAPPRFEIERRLGRLL